MLPALAASLTLALSFALPQTARADAGLDAPEVPASLAVPAGHEAFMMTFAVGTQNYVCLPTATGYGWGFFGPQATLFNDDEKQVLTHFLSGDPNGTARPSWMHSKDSSTIWAAALATASSTTNPEFVMAGAIPWLLLEVVDGTPGPTDGDKLLDAVYVHRVHTFGGVAPASGCAVATDVGKKALVPYTTEYWFYREA